MSESKAKAKARAALLEKACLQAISMCRDLTEDPPAYWEVADFLEGIVTGVEVKRDEDGQRIKPAGQVGVDGATDQGA